jgi:tRNA (guanine37-N1)-methyltransferase
LKTSNCKLLYRLVKNRATIIHIARFLLYEIRHYHNFSPAAGGIPLRRDRHIDMIKFDIITIFPDIFNSYFSESIIKRAQKKGLIKINIHNLRDFTNDKHKTVDDGPYGGGPGMVIRADVIYKAVKALIKSEARNPKSETNSKSKFSKSKTKIILFSAKGKKFDQKMAQRFSKLDKLIMICGRYEGVDERVAQYIVDEEISIGDYVLTGGEIPAMVVVDAVSRFIPGVLGKHESLEEIKGSYSVYTRPEEIVINKRKRKAPEVLLSGNHKKIEEWRKKLDK